MFTINRLYSYIQRFKEEKMKRTCAILPLLFCAFACQPDQTVTFSDSELEKFRPEYHFTPDSGWMNDPNGLVYLNKEYHLFYQHYPDSTVWGPMHWGHAISRDLTSWEHLPIAIQPDSLGYIFSGSAVFDSENSSGLGTAENPPLIAIYTYHDMEAERSGKSNTFQSQAIAYSLDKGRNWTKYKGNPVLSNPGIRDFRDPKVSRITGPEGNESWVMTLAVSDHINFYSSSDLIHWNLTGEFGKGIGVHGGVWECPDLLELSTPSGEKKWVLLVSINPGGPQQGSATQYFIGDFQNGEFVPDDTMIRWVDYGPDNYAGVTWANLPKDQNRTLFIGWMSNWLYAQAVPTESWRSAMTLPRELSLFEVDGTLLLKSAPATEMKQLRTYAYKLRESTGNLPSQAVEITADISSSDSFVLLLTNELGEKLGITKDHGLVSIDRTMAGISDFHDDFATVHSAPMSWKAEEIRVFLDAHSIEVFLNDGELVMTSTVFPNSPWKSVEMANGLKNIEIHDLKK